MSDFFTGAIAEHPRHTLAHGTASPEAALLDAAGDAVVLGEQIHSAGHRAVGLGVSDLLRYPRQATWRWPPRHTAGGAVTWMLAFALAALPAGTALVAWIAVDSAWRHVLPLGVSAALLVAAVRLLVAADGFRRTQGRAALLEERLRVAREIHDVVGHKMALIALKAEVAGQHALSDVARTRAETAEIAQLTRSTLRDVRRALHGDTAEDLDTQLQTAFMVLSSAGFSAHVDKPPYALTGPESRLLGAVVREGITNILRHADPSQVTVQFGSSARWRELIISNDLHNQPDQPEQRGDSLGGVGLQGLGARCAAMGARLEVIRGSRSFTLVVHLPRLGVSLNQVAT